MNDQRYGTTADYDVITEEAKKMSREEWCSIMRGMLRQFEDTGSSMVETKTFREWSGNFGAWKSW
jgi:hypothetical protein